MSCNPVPTINKDDLTTDWIDSLQRCLQWSERTVQKALSASDMAAVMDANAAATAAQARAQQAANRL